MWNLRDESVPWVARMSTIVGSEETYRSKPQPVTGFGAFDCATFRHTTTLTAGGLLALVATRSSYLTAAPVRQAEIDAGMRELVAGLPERFELPYVTVAFRSARDGGAG